MAFMVVWRTGTSSSLVAELVCGLHGFGGRSRLRSSLSGPADPVPGLQRQVWSALLPAVAR